MALNIISIIDEHNDKVCEIIRSVGTEFGAIGDGFGPSDTEVSAMSRYYQPENRAAYYVAILDEKIVGCGGISQFAHHQNICELRKLFLLPEVRGQGIGRALCKKALIQAQQFDYQHCYLDTLSNMTSAIALYTSLGFEQLNAPYPGTVHNGCDIWMLKSF
jgi:putative acetyltransferase